MADDTTPTPTEDTTPPPAPARRNGSLVTDGSGRYGVFLGGDDPAGPLVSWLPAPAVYGADLHDPK